MSSLSASLRFSRKSPGNGSRRADFRRGSAALICAIGLVAPTSASAAPGDLDPTFGTGGMVTTDIGGVTQVNGAAVQADGRIVIAGFTAVPATGKGSFVVARYTSSGALDSSFGTAGKSVTSMGKDARAFGMTLQADGRIVAAGYTQVTSGKKSFALTRYRTDGHLDTTFGSGGKATTTWGAGGEAHAVALAPDGKIIAAGWSVMTGSQQFALARYKSNGRIDTSFGKAGRVSAILGRSSAVAGVAVQSDGKIVAAGYVSAAGNIVHIAVARYLVNGSPDPSFGTNGVVITNLGGREQARSVALQPDGKIVAAGQILTNQSNFALVRFDVNGHLDPSFGSNGVAISNFGNSSVAFAVAVSQSGSILAAGFAYLPGQFRGNFALANFTQSGTPDPAFGTGGKLLTDFSDYAEVHAVAFQGGATPTIVAVGFDGADGNGGKFAVARYLDN